MNTKIVKLKNGDMEITLCGAVHIGTQKYFDKLNSIANESDIVLFEGVQAKTIDLLKLFYIKLGEILGLTMQNRNGYEKNPRWINSDMNYEIFKKYMKNNIINKLPKDQKEIDELFNEDVIKYTRWFIVFMFKIMPLFIFFSRKQPVLIELRNYNVLVDITKQFENHNKVAVIYGDGHLNHLIKNLKQLNFKVVDKKCINNMEK